MGKRTQAGHTPTPSENSNNQTRTGTERVSRGVSHINSTRKKKNPGIPNTFKGSVTEFGAVLGTKYDNFKEIFQNLQESVLQYVVANYNKGLYLAPLVSKIEEVYLSSK